MSISNVSMKPYYFSKITLFSTTTLMSGEIACSTEEGKGKAIGFLIVNGVRNGGPCHNSSDCITDRAVCLNGICDCPPNQFRIRHPHLGYDVCREIVQSLYDPCEFNEQCIHFVDSKSICNTVCVCAPHARDRKGRCVSLSEISYNRSQEMYRVGLIAVTCIIILIVAMSLWVTLKRSCQERNPNSHRRSVAQANSSDTIVELSSDKPPSYDDVLVSGENVSSPPNIKEALKNCMTAKRLLRQVSAPAGQLLTQTIPSSKPGGMNKRIPEM
ncbi:uncharacterized protein LOC129217411 [Uloborus diversus]|uniref:uncharacterized protein LOC129217411 n=1 Tax=Uloborus diversus TaxID=327109 RepID=UPI0024097696|nr:uncharacterized protein LOC129217411 [Uloborus diversus]XP_054707684.1 uncharacterized protein LOC129217411 [Uloborus diversus]